MIMRDSSSYSSGHDTLDWELISKVQRERWDQVRGWRYLRYANRYPDHFLLLKLIVQHYVSPDLTPRYAGSELLQTYSD